MKDNKTTILCIDDDRDLQTVLRIHIEDEGYAHIAAHSGAEVEDMIKRGVAFGAVLLDLGLPDSQGFSLISRIRAASKAPIIIVSGKSETTEKIVGLELGADDYITKPFELRELSARIRAVLRRAQTKDPALAAPAGDGPADIVFDGWRLDRAKYQAFDAQGAPMNLTTGEFRLLEALALSCNRAVSREQLFEWTRAGSYESFDRAIDIQIGRIRKKLGDDSKNPRLIKTVRGVGYMLTAEKKA